jgi:WD40 repeat protein
MEMETREINLHSGFSNVRPRVTGFWRTTIRSLFGYDIFICYARADAASYAELLETTLEAGGFATFRDEGEIGAGERLDDTLRKAIRRSRQFLLLDTPKARQSNWVKDEIEARLNGKRSSVTRIKFDGTTPKNDEVGSPTHDFDRKVEVFVWIDETQAALISGKPSDGIIERIAANFGKIRLRNLLRIVVAVVFTTLLASLVWSITMTIQARRQTRIAVSRQLAAQASAELWQSPESSAKDAVDAMSRFVTEEARKALDQAVSQSQVVRVLKDSDNAPLSAVAFSRDGHAVLTSTYWGKVWLWDPVMATPKRSFPCGGYYRASRDSMSPDEKYLLTAIDSQQGYWIAIHDSTTGVELGRFAASEVGPIVSATFSPSGRYIATAGEDYGASIWDANAILRALSSSDSKAIRLAPTRRREKLHSDIVNSIRFGDNEDYVVTASQDGRAKLWNWKSNNVIELRRFTRALYSAEFKPNNIHVVLTAGQDGHATLWDDALDKHISLDRQWHKLDAMQASFDSTGVWVVTASADGRSAVWNTQDERKNYTLEGHRGAVSGAAFSPDGRFVVTSSVDATARIWTAQPLPHLGGDEAKIQYLKTLNEGR